MTSDSAFSDDVAFAARGQRGPRLFFLLVLGLGLQSLQNFLEARKTISWSCFLFCTDLGKEGRRGGSKANKARQGRQFVIMIGSAVAFWPGGNLIPGIIALAFSCAGSLPHVCLCVCVYAYVCVSSLRPLSISGSCGGGDPCCFRAATRSVSGRRPYSLALFGGRSAPKITPHRLGLLTNRGARLNPPSSRYNEMNNDT